MTRLFLMTKAFDRLCLAPNGIPFSETNCRGVPNRKAKTSKPLTTKVKNDKNGN